MSTIASRLVKRDAGVLALLFLILAVCCSGISAHAQEVTATINGTVTDPAGRVVTKAEVKARDLDRGTVWSARTNDSGFYSLSHLPVGRYEVRVQVTGFEAAVESPIELQLNQVSAVNFRLVVGSENQTVQVTSAAPLLQTDTTDVGTVIDARTNVSLPLASRNYLQLALTNSRRSNAAARRIRERSKRRPGCAAGDQRQPLRPRTATCSTAWITTMQEATMLSILLSRTRSRSSGSSPRMLRPTSVATWAELSAPPSRKVRTNTTAQSSSFSETTSSTQTSG